MGCDVEVFSRVTGFFRPIQVWNKGKVAEFNDRERYDIKGAKEIQGEILSKDSVDGSSE